MPPHFMELRDWVLSPAGSANSPGCLPGGHTQKFPWLPSLGQGWGRAGPGASTPSSIHPGALSQQPFSQNPPQFFPHLQPRHEAGQGERQVSVRRQAHARGSPARLGLTRHANCPGPREPIHADFRLALALTVKVRGGGWGGKFMCCRLWGHGH